MAGVHVGSSSAQRHLAFQASQTCCLRAQAVFADLPTCSAGRLLPALQCSPLLVSPSPYAAGKPAARVNEFPTEKHVSVWLLLLRKHLIRSFPFKFALFFPVLRQRAPGDRFLRGF